MVSRVHDQPVGNEQKVEFTALGNAGNFGRDRKIVVADRGPIVAPAGGMVAGAEHEHAEMHLTSGGTHSRGSPNSAIAVPPAASHRAPWYPRCSSTAGAGRSAPRPMWHNPSRRGGTPGRAI